MRWDIELHHILTIQEHVNCFSMAYWFQIVLDLKQLLNARFQRSGRSTSLPLFVRLYLSVTAGKLLWISSACHLENRLYKTWPLRRDHTLQNLRFAARVDICKSIKGFALDLRQSYIQLLFDICSRRIIRASYCSAVSRCQFSRLEVGLSIIWLTLQLHVWYWGFSSGNC